MKILLLDIETTPNLVYAWKSQLWAGHIGTAQMVSHGEILCWSAKWLGSPEIFFGSLQRSKKRTMLMGIHKLLSEADAVITYNGISFDMTELNREFLQHGIKPPAPYKNIDLYLTVKRVFRFASNKLDYVCEALGLGGKKDTNFQLWVDCMNNVPEAWKQMGEYNRNDVALLERLYTHLLPWIPNHPNHGMYVDGRPVCPNCGSEHSQRRGLYFKKALKYLRYQCVDCGKWFAGTKAINLATKPKVAGI
jgi:hypothetical protein